LEDRLGDGYDVIIGEVGQILLLEDGKVVSEIDVEGQVSFRHGSEIVHIPIEKLDILDGKWVSIDMQRTEEMGVPWLEIVLDEGGKVIEIPEPVVGLPETYEETLIVKEESLDYFMPKLLAAEKKWLDENESIMETNYGRIAFPYLSLDHIRLPYTERAVNVASRPCCAAGGGFVNEGSVVISSWTRVLMDSGKKLEIVGIPNIAHDRFSEFGSENNYIWHYVYDKEVAINWLSTEAKKWGRPDYTFEVFKQGMLHVRARMFLDVREVEWLAEEYGWTQDEIQLRITSGGFEDIDILMKRLIRNVPNHGEALGIQMICTGDRIAEGSCQAPEGFLEIMEVQLLPALYLDSYE